MEHNDNLLLSSIFSCIDNTTLEGSDTTARVTQLCNDSLRMVNPQNGINHVAAVCVYPVFVSLCRNLLKDSPIHVAAVAGAFPSGQSPLPVKLQEVRYAVQEGADEIDMVISRGALIEGRSQQVFDEIAAIRQEAASCTLKVILETGELTPELIRQASTIAIQAGADFIKTSTGKIPVGATLEAAKIMLQVIHDHHLATNKLVGFKAAGGVSTPEQALDYYRLAQSILGIDHIDNHIFRIGASRLTNRLYQHLNIITNNN